VFALTALILATTATVHAFRRPTPAERHALVVATKRSPYVSDRYPFRLYDIRISTQGPWAAAEAVQFIRGQGPNRATGVYRLYARWKLVQLGSDCGIGTHIGMPRAVRRELRLGCRAASRQPTVIPCAVPYDFRHYDFRQHPHRCTEYVGKRYWAHANQVTLASIRWRGWRSPHARGRGLWVYCCMGGHQTGPARLHAYHLVHRCGRRVYTRLRVRLSFTGGDNFSHRFSLPACV
jgi:hypothetical protein